MYINTPWEEPRSKSIDQTGARVHSSHGDGTNLKRKRLEEYDWISSLFSYKAYVMMRTYDSHLNHDRIRTSWGYKNWRSSIDHSLGLYNGWVAARHIGQLVSQLTRCHIKEIRIKEISPDFDPFATSSLYDQVQVEMHPDYETMLQFSLYLSECSTLRRDL